jgi:hypothetical protein
VEPVPPEPVQDEAGFALGDIPAATNVVEADAEGADDEQAEPTLAESAGEPGRWSAPVARPALRLAAQGLSRLGHAALEGAAAIEGWMR